MNNILRNFSRFALLVAFVASTAGCGLYGKFKTPEYEETENAYGDVEVVDTTNTGNIAWQDFFPDEKLSALIDEALVNNLDMKTAVLKIQEAQASLKAARLAYVPAFSFGASESWSGSTKNYKTWSSNWVDGGWGLQLPVSASWQFDIFGSLTNAKRRQLAATMSSVEYARSVHASLVSTVAIQYYTLLALDREYEVYKETAQLWKETVENTEALMEAGRYNSSAVSQSKANYYSVCNYVIEVEQQIRQTENQINSMLGKVSGTPIDRGSFADWTTPESIEVGFPAEVLSNRPDVRQAEMTFAQAFYTTNGTRSAFYPSITITGAYSFYDIIANAVFSLVQPIFQQGQLRANYKVAKAQQEEASLAFKQSIINAGIEVNNAVINLKSAQAKTSNYAEQVSNLQDAVESTKLLMQHGTSTYLEVLTAQQSLLSAQISEITNRLSEISATISLYQALGGGADLSDLE